MIDEIHLEREGAGGLRVWIPLAEWCEVVERTDGVRIAADRQPRVNPETGRTINFGDVRGEAEVYFPDDESWRLSFRWDPAGYIAFQTPADLHDAQSPLRRIALDLARRLRAVVVGGHGEIYH